MAFVIESQRKLHELSKTACPLGPGQYFNQSSSPSQKKQCAPFQSTSRRRSFFQSNINTHIKPGPGNYQISQPIIQPNIKTVSNSQSIIVKINSTGTAQFKSVVERFGADQDGVPGPGQYYYGGIGGKKRSTSQRSIHQSSIIQRIKQLNNKKNYPAIPEKIRGLTDAKKEEVNPQGKLGPAFYDPRKNFYLNSSSTVWGKDKSRRFSQDHKTEMGPGKYNPLYNPIKPDDRVIQPSSHFKSNTVRTYFDSLIYKTNIDETAKMRDIGNFKTKDPAPGHYETNISSIKVQEKPFALQFFGSTVQRFPQYQIPQKKHKSFYNIRSQIGQNKSFNKSEHAFMFDTTRKPEFLNANQKHTAPGPGHYRQNVKVQKKLKGNKLQKFGTNTKRMFQQQDKLNQVGPGKYQPDQQKFQNPKNLRFGQVSQISSNFRSTTNRQCFGTAPTASPFLEYDVTSNDLSKKLQKQKNFLQNLQKIDVQKPPFESTISRFPHYEQPSQPSRKQSLENSHQQELSLRRQEQKIRQQILQANLGQVREGKKRNFGGEDRWKGERKGGPAVGQYAVKMGWEKRSHNVKYQNK